MKRMRLILIVGLAAATLAAGVAATNPQATDRNCRYFSETGQWVCGGFLEFFDARGGLETFGYPLTQPFHDPTHGGLYVQYFQRARMEWHPGNPEPYKVQLGLLIDELGYDFPPARPEEVASATGPLHRYFPETRHIVSYAFLDYFRERGGLDIFGYPRSELMYEGGRIVQYFQRARLSWHPESPFGSQMRLANLGEIYIEEIGLPGPWDEPVPGSTRLGELVDVHPGDGEGTTFAGMVTRLGVSAVVRYPIPGPRASQTLFVYVTDQRHLPADGVSVTAVVRYPSGQQILALDSTDEDGFTKRTFDILPTAPGKRVVIDVTASYQGLEGTTQTFFLPWW